MKQLLDELLLSIKVCCKYFFNRKKVELMNSNIVLRVALAGAIGFGLVGCMHTSSGVIPMDKGTYYISQDDSRLGMGPPGVETISAVYKEANEFCAKEGKEVKKVNNIYTDSGFAKVANFSLEFNCVNE